MSKNLKILAIDDDKISQKFILRAVKDEYETISVYNGEDGLKAANDEKPDLILLDVEMPGMNGYEVCDQLKQSDATKQIPVVFLSGHSSLRERMQGFEVGGDDYVVKPFVAEDLRAKLAVLTKYRDRSLDLENQVSEAQKTAFTAMTGSSELGQAMALVEKSYLINNYEALAESLFVFTRKMYLNCSVLINANGKQLCFSSKGNISPLEIELITMLHAEKRFHDFGCRTQINYPNISLLIKNMPLEDMERYGRIKDLMPPILGALDAKIRSLNIESAIREQSIELTDSFRTIKETIKDLGRSMRENSKGGQLVLSNMLGELTNQLPGMALEDDQENFILDCIEAAVKTANSISSAGDNISESFEMVIIQLQSLVEKHNELVDISIVPENQLENHDADIEEAASSDIELF